MFETETYSFRDFANLCLVESWYWPLVVDMHISSVNFFSDGYAESHVIKILF